MDARRIDYNLRGARDHDHLGAETECNVIDGEDFGVQGILDGDQAVYRVINFLREKLGEPADNALRAICGDVTVKTLEANPRPLKSPRSTAAAQRLYSILIDLAAELIGQKTERNLHTLHGATWRPSGASPQDVSTRVPLDRQAYYAFQTREHGDKVADATGDHFNESQPWLEQHVGPHEYSDKMTRLTGRMRLVITALAMGLSASSPLYYAHNGNPNGNGIQTTLTRFDSARLGLIWRGRTDLDVSVLWRDDLSYQSVMKTWVEEGVIPSARALWVPERAQAGDVRGVVSFEEFCSEKGISLDTPEAIEQAKRWLIACYQYGPYSKDNAFVGDPKWRDIWDWHVREMMKVVRTPRNRVETRVGETPFYSPQTESENALIPYEYLKSFHALLELSFLWLSESPELIDGLECDERSFNAAKDNEDKILREGLDARISWPAGFARISARGALGRLLTELKPWIDAFGYQEEMDIFQRIARRETHTPAERIRLELAGRYGSRMSNRGIQTFLPDDDYPRELLNRTRNAMTLELDAIRRDLPKFPDSDRVVIQSLLELIDQLKS